jgi:hypothetical protein
LITPRESHLFDQQLNSGCWKVIINKSSHFTKNRKLIMKKGKDLLILVIMLLSSCAPPPLLVPTTLPETQEVLTPDETPIVSGVPTIDPTLATLQLAVLPPELRTGIAELDLVIDAVLKHAFQSLRGLTAFTQIGCTNADSLGGPPKCSPDEVEGTVVEVVPFMGAEGHHKRREEYQTWEGPDVLGLLAVYKVSALAYSTPSFPAGDYALVFLDHQGATTLTMQVSQGKIIRYDYRDGSQIESEINQNSEEVLLALSFQPIPTPVPWNQFADLEGRFSFVYPPLMTIQENIPGQRWVLENQIRIEIISFDNSWITCFDRALGDCPIVESDQMVNINGKNVRRIEGYIGSVGGNIPQEFMAYIFTLGDQALVMTVYALPFDTQVSDYSMIWPLEGMELELFERTVQTVILN